MRINELKKEDIKELKKDSYICISTDQYGNITGIYKAATEAENANGYDIIIL